MEITVGEVRPVGMTSVSEPIIIISLDDMTVCPAESVKVKPVPKTLLEQRIRQNLTL